MLSFNDVVTRFHIRSHGIYSPGGRHVLVTMGLINGAPISVGKAAWKVFLPGAIGNIIGGSFLELL